MKVHVHPVDFIVDQKLVDLTQKRLDKPDNFYDRTIEADIHPELDNTTTKENKIIEVKVHIPGESSIVKRQFKTFEEGIDSVITPLERMLSKHKEKRQLFVKTIFGKKNSLIFAPLYCITYLIKRE